MILRALVLSTFSVIAASQAFAAPIDIPANKLPSYKQAVELAGKQTIGECKETYGAPRERYMVENVKQAQSATLDASGGQPILVFKRQVSPDFRAITKVVSSNDFKRIISYTVEEQEMGDINTGDLLNPVIARGYLKTAFVECR